MTWSWEVFAVERERPPQALRSLAIPCTIHANATINTITAIITRQKIPYRDIASVMAMARFLKALFFKSAVTRTPVGRHLAARRIYPAKRAIKERSSPFSAS